MARLLTCSKALQNRLAWQSALQAGMLTRQTPANNVTASRHTVKHVQAVLTFARHALRRIRFSTLSLECATLIAQLKAFLREKIPIPVKHALKIAPRATLSQTARHAMRTYLLWSIIKKDNASQSAPSLHSSGLALWKSARNALSPASHAREQRIPAWPVLQDSTSTRVLASLSVPKDMNPTTSKCVSARVRLLCPS